MGGRRVALVLGKVEERELCMVLDLVRGQYNRKSTTDSIEQGLFFKNDSFPKKRDGSIADTLPPHPPTMIRSRVTLARMEAAAMQRTLESPLTTQSAPASRLGRSDGTLSCGCVGGLMSIYRRGVCVYAFSHTHAF